MLKKRFLSQSQQTESSLPHSPELDEFRLELQDRLRQLGYAESLQIRCALRDQTLLVLAEHLLHIEPEPNRTFATLEAAIKTFAPELLEAESNAAIATSMRRIPVQLYLRIAGHHQPYAARSFQLELVPPPVPSIPMGPVDILADPEAVRVQEERPIEVDPKARTDSPVELLSEPPRPPQIATEPAASEIAALELAAPAELEPVSEPSIEVSSDSAEGVAWEPGEPSPAGDSNLNLGETEEQTIERVALTEPVEPSEPDAASEFNALLDAEPALGWIASAMLTEPLPSVEPVEASAEARIDESVQTEEQEPTVVALPSETAEAKQLKTLDAISISIAGDLPPLLVPPSLEPSAVVVEADLLEEAYAREAAAPSIPLTLASVEPVSETATADTEPADREALETAALELVWLVSEMLHIPATDLIATPTDVEPDPTAPTTLPEADEVELAALEADAVAPPPEETISMLNLPVDPLPDLAAALPISLISEPTPLEAIATEDLPYEDSLFEDSQSAAENSDDSAETEARAEAENTAVAEALEEPHPIALERELAEERDEAAGDFTAAFTAAVMPPPPLQVMPSFEESLDPPTTEVLLAEQDAETTSELPESSFTLTEVDSDTDGDTDSDADSDTDITALTTASEGLATDGSSAPTAELDLLEIALAEPEVELLEQPGIPEVGTFAAAVEETTESPLEPALEESLEELPEELEDQAPDNSAEFAERSCPEEPNLEWIEVPPPETAQAETERAESESSVEQVLDWEPPSNLADPPIAPGSEQDVEAAQPLDLDETEQVEPILEWVAPESFDIDDIEPERTPEETAPDTPEAFDRSDPLATNAAFEAAALEEFGREVAARAPDRADPEGESATIESPLTHNSFDSLSVEPSAELIASIEPADREAVPPVARLEIEALEIEAAAEVLSETESPTESQTEAVATVPSSSEPSVAEALDTANVAVNAAVELPVAEPPEHPQLEPEPPVAAAMDQPVQNRVLEGEHTQTVAPLPVSTSASAPASTVGLPLVPPVAEPPAPASRFRLAPSVWVTGSAVGLFTLLGAVYLLTRPCVIGSCEPYEKAERLSQEAIQTAQTTDSALEIVEAYRKLNEASYLLGTIPSWSKHYDAAQSLLASYETEAVVLEQIVTALKQANTAAQRSQNPPHPLQEWREIQRLWRETIAQLQQIPASNALYPLAQRKLQEYEANLANINQRLLTEQQAQQRIDEARKAGQLAEARAEEANSIASWQQIYATWEAAIHQLRQVPQGTMAYAEAEQLLALYQPKLTEANTRRGQEEVAASAYDEAVRLGKQARVMEQENQWSRAVSYWQDALNQARRVPSGTAYHTQVQPLITNYTSALKQAQDNLQRATAAQSAKPDLDRTCAGNPRICTYTLSPEAIRVQFTPAYDQVVERIIFSSQTGSAATARAEVVAQVNGLLRTLGDIGSATQMPVELYNSNGTKLGTYTPIQSGYAPQP